LLLLYSACACLQEKEETSSETMFRVYLTCVDFNSMGIIKKEAY